MEKLQFMLSFLALILAASLALSCGSSPGQRQSITLDPTTADAEAQFTATGHFIHPTRTVAPQSATWSACFQDTPTTDVSVTTGGMAQCASGATGTYTVFAFDTIPACEIPSNQCGEGCTIVGTAQLKLPLGALR